MGQFFSTHQSNDVLMYEQGIPYLVWGIHFRHRTSILEDIRLEMNNTPTGEGPYKILYPDQIISFPSPEKNKLITSLTMHSNRKSVQFHSFVSFFIRNDSILDQRQSHKQTWVFCNIEKKESTILKMSEHLQIIYKIQIGQLKQSIQSRM